MMDGWIFRPGYPLLSVRQEGESLILTQQRFTYLPAEEPVEQPAEPFANGASAEKPPAPAPETWQTPVRLAYFRGDVVENAHHLLHGVEEVVRLPPDASAVLLNEGGHGFFRVRYAPELLQRLLRRLPDLSAVDRFNLVNDIWALTLAGQLPLAEFLDLTRRLGDERDRNVWSLVIAAFGVLHRLVDEDDRQRLESLVRDRLSAAVAALGWEARPEEEELTRQLRGDLLRLLRHAGQ